jgi:hypothetical protein
MTSGYQDYLVTSKFGSVNEELPNLLSRGFNVHEKMTEIERGYVEMHLDRIKVYQLVNQCNAKFQKVKGFSRGVEQSRLMSVEMQELPEMVATYVKCRDIFVKMVELEGKYKEMNAELVRDSKKYETIGEWKEEYQQTAEWLRGYKKKYEQTEAMYQEVSVHMEEFYKLYAEMQKKLNEMREKKKTEGQNKPSAAAASS